MKIRRLRPLVVWPLYLSGRELSRVGRGDDDDEARVRSVGGNEREERLDDYTTRTITPNAGSSARDDAVPAGGSRAHGRGDGSSPNQIRGTRHMQVELPKPAWNTKPMSEGTNRPATTLTTTPSAPSPARTPASAAPRPSRADPPRSARAAAPRRASAPAPSPAAASPNPPRWSASADRS